MNNISTLRLFFATDLHGSEKCFRKFLAAKKFYKVDALILGGDLTGKLVIPIVEKPDGTYTSKFLGRDFVLKNRDEVSKLEENVKTVGYYPCHLSLSELEELRNDDNKRHRLFLRLASDRLERWIRLAEEYFRGSGDKIYVTGGNDDPLEIEYLLNKSDVFINCEGKVIELNKYHEMISSGYSNMTPWKCPRDVEDEELGKKIVEMTSKVKNMKTCIFNLHAPPYDTTIDLAIEVVVRGNEVVRVMKGVSPSVIPVGSKAVRQAIEKHQPLLGLHGHIHESRGVFKLGRTLCINPGSEYSEGILRGVIVTLDKEKIVDYFLTSG